MDTELDRQARRQVIAAWFVTGGVIVAAVVVYLAVASVLAG